MTLYDTHAHFGDGDDVAAICARAAEAGVTRILAIGGSEELNRNALRAPGRVALGWDRDQLDDVEDRLRALPDLLAAHAPRVAALGEIGLDCHYTPQTLRAQCDLFARQLALADERALPVVIHTREADDATLGVLDEVPWRHGDRLRGVIHSYTGAPAFAGKALDRGFMISFSGIATFKTADVVRASARYVPDDRILVETDSPYLSPVPLRGRPCEPAFVVHTARRLAEERRMDLETFAALTTANAISLFES
ncbi:MAG: TatD family hydrolase [Kiritimatiellia bacterium]